MKVDLIRKFKWYIIGFILVAIMLSVSLSFCAWDSLSIKSSMSGSGGKFTEKPTKYVLVEDRFLPNNVPGLNNLVDVGDVVTFGKYYQDFTKSGDIAEKTPIRWIVVEKVNNQLTLLAEKVMAFGSFWGNWYYNGSSWVWATQVNGSYYQNYEQSTLRAWLNSNYTLRNDAGTAFSKTHNEPRFRGFMNEAFTSDEQAYIIDKEISGIKGYAKDNNPSTPTQAYETATDKVWVPSWSEVYGTTTTPWGTTIDGSPNARFSYFNATAYNTGNTILNGYTTAYASSKYSNYTFTGATNIVNAQSSSASGNVWWWLRSPHPSYYSDALMVGTGGSGSGANTYYSYGGVRPAVCVPL